MEGNDFELLREGTDLVPEFDEVPGYAVPFTVMRAEHLLNLNASHRMKSTNAIF